MRRTFLFFVLFFFLQSAYSQNKTIGLVLNSNLSWINVDEKIDPLLGFEIGASVKFPLRNKLDFETGATFRFQHYQVNSNTDPAPYDKWKEQVFYFKIPLELSYHLTPNKWRGHLGVWCSYLLTANFDRDAFILEHRTLYSDVLFGFNFGIGHLLQSGVKVKFDFSMSINNIYGGQFAEPFGDGKIGLGALSFGALVPLKFKL